MNKNFLSKILVPLTIFILAYLFYGPNSDSYRVCILEYSPIVVASSGLVTKEKARSQQLKNLNEIGNYMSICKESKGKLFVTPEYSLTDIAEWDRTTVEPYLHELPIREGHQWNPCLDDEEKMRNYTRYGISEVVKRASCLARENEMYFVVGGMNEVEYTKTTTTTKTTTKKQYNSAAIFSNNGELVTKHRKAHLYGNEQKIFDRPDNKAGENYFDTPFSGRIGILICAELLFGKEINEMKESHDYDTLVFPTYWVNFLPLLVSTSFQSELSRQTNSIIIGANSGSKGKLSSGSGVFQNGNTIKQYINPSDKAKSKLLIVDVPKKNKKSNKKTIQPQNKKPDLPILKQALKPKFKVFNATPGKEETIFFENNGIVCNVSFQISTKKVKQVEQFAIIVDRGSTIAPAFAQYCGLMRCVKDPLNLYPCKISNVTRSNTIFNHFKITSNFQSQENAFGLVVSDNLIVQNSQDIKITKSSITSKNSQHFKLLSAVLYNFGEFEKV
ncbi:biotinidase-related [Anaeramoeba flamelloides]|uniref:Biotinidase-related n=1 Tax=Anaeramoeba flamelloides TaxID=1746091 RepID=A0AAV7Z4Z8_9EUKA|nr:biotinidase-related [Anaeramoeba flamelloides]